MEVLRCDEVLGGAMGPPAVVVVADMFLVAGEEWEEWDVGCARDVFRAES